ncbi:unnamed protein product [Ceutorhynchus assimilis]|uniref:Trafficking protein particle complex subunit 8 n=1 Tax=Ceutorhynchus assimilis TaxID=467358 RepID=A0A9N9QHY7_9CUCU|nr:unnamed protein product [Ceutorhynchus assimilis]
MAQSNLGPQDFIKDAFTPQIAVMCTQAVRKCCEKNHLDFTELLQPFSKLTNDVSYKDSTGIVTTVKNLKLAFFDVKSRPPQTTLARKLLNSSVGEAPKPRMKIYETKNYQFEIPQSTPWFESWKETFLKVQYPSDHEFTKHFLGCLLVVSSTDDHPVEAMIQLTQNLNDLQNVIDPGKLPKWFNSDVFKYYIILHDNVEGEISVATSAFESLKTSYGAPNCFLLKMNSRTPGQNNQEHLADPWCQFLNNKIDIECYQTSSDDSPDLRQHSLEVGQEANELKNTNYHPLSPELEYNMNDLDMEKDESAFKSVEKWSHGVCLSVDDIEQIKAMIYELTKLCLIPYLEKQLAILNDCVANKKGMSKSLLSATKRWFTANKPTASTTSVNNLIYPLDSPELQIRKLADLYFMFGNYSAAFQAYHSAKRDYNADQAWLYYAGALEMASLAAFMANESSRKTYDYMEEGITTYLVTCKLPQFATRATILSFECLKFKQLYGETAHQLIRMTSEDSDLRSALLLEQASYCFLQSNMFRKYAFHMVLAGHRFFKAAQKKHSLRCYKQAYQIYENTGWALAADHIHYTIGRLANNLQKFDEAVISFAKLLTGESKQSASQQGTFLKEYLTILEVKLKMDDSKDMPILPVPEVNNSLIKVLVGPTKPLSTPGKVPAEGIHFNSSKDSNSESRWHKLEEMLLLEEPGNVPLIFKPMATLYSATAMNANTPLAIINEPIQVSVQLSNPLQTILQLKNLYLLWNYRNDDERVSNLEINENSDKYIKTYVTKSIIIQGGSMQDLILNLTPLVTGDVTITGLCYTLMDSNNNADSISIKGKKEFNVSSNSSLIKHINLKVVPYAPCLQMIFSDINLEFLSGELQRVSVDLQNTGSVPLKNIMIATSVPHLLSNCELKPNVKEYTVSDGDSIQIKDKLARKNHITTIPLPDNILESGQTISFHIWIKAPSDKGPSIVDLLTYYENIDSKSVPRYRLIRHSWNLSVQESISVEVSTQTSYNSSVAENLALALKTTNLNRIHNTISTEITLLNIALVSNNWILTKDIVTPKYINLNSQESAHILIKAKRKVHQDNQYSSIPLSSDKAELPHLPTALRVFARKSHETLLNSFQNNFKYKTRDGTLILEWKALVSDGSERRIVHGQTCVPVEIIRGEQQLDALISDTVIDLNSSLTEEDRSIENAKKQVTYNLLYPPVVTHNFKNRSTCVVPVTLVLHSIIENDIIIMINTIDPSLKTDTNVNRLNKSNLSNSQAASNFSWVSSGKIIRTLRPLTTSSVKLSVIVVSPGTFDLGANLGIYCSALGADHIPVLQLYEVPSSLIVVDSYS